MAVPKGPVNPLFEYRVLQNNGTSTEIEKLLIRAGREGWELVAVDTSRLYLKRPA